MIDVIGDVLHFDGYVVGRLSPVPATVRDRLDTALSNAYIEEPEPEPGPPFVDDETEAEILKRAKDTAQAGFVSLAELAAIIANVKKGA